MGKKFEDLYEETFILNIDFLGFSKFVENHDRKQVINIFTEWVSHINFSGSVLSSLGKNIKESPETQEYFDKLAENNHIEIMVYSDTIAIKSNNPDKNMHFGELINIAKSIQASQYYKTVNPHSIFLPMRGTITHGEFIFYKGGIEFPSAYGDKIKIKTHNTNIILGKAIIDAYLNEKDMEIMAIALTENCIKKVSSDIYIAPYFYSFLKENRLIKYTIPCKGRNTDSYLINPLIKGPLAETAIKRLKEKAQKIDGRTKIHRKYKNTIDFLEYIDTSNLYNPI